MSVYRPLSPRFDFEAAQDLQAYSMPISMTGRVHEFKQLRTQIENLQAGKGGILLIEGEKGVGKSLLVTQVRHHFSRQAGNQIETRARKSSTALPIEMESVEITWLKGVCRSYDQTWPFSAWLDVLYQWLGVQPDKPVEEKRDRLRYLTLVLWGDAQERYYPYLATFLSIPLEDAGTERVRYLDAEGLRKQLFISIRSWIESLSRRGPLVVSFVDMQWIDHASLELLKYCLPLCDSRPLVWLGIYRPDRMSPAWEFKQHVEREYPHRLTLVEMGSLNERDSRELIQQLVGPLALSGNTTSMIVAKSEGNPYFMREILTSLIAQDVLKQDAETGFLTETKPVTSLELPDNLQSLLLERLDRLSPEENQVLKAASVMGITFWYEVLKELTPEISLLDNHLTSLQRRGLIQEQNQITGLGMEYGFNSSLVRDVVYESMLEHQREDYHRKVAVFLEDCACIEQWLQHSSLIAYHYHYANDPKKELFYSLKAAEQARKLYANTEAYKHLTRALELLDEMESNLVISENYEVIQTHKFEALSDRSQVNLLIGQPEEAAQDAHELLVLADLLADDPYWRVDAILRQSEVNNPDNLDALEKGLAIIKEAIEISRKLEDKNRELQCLMRMAYLQSLKREPIWKITAENALRMAEELGDHRSQVLLLLWFASAYGIDDLETNLIYLESAIPIIELLDDKMIEMQLLRAFAEQYERNGDYYRQLTEFEQKRLQLSREIGSRVVEGDALMYCGQVQALYLGDYEGGLTRLREALRLYESTPARLFPLLRIAQTLTILGRYKDAQDALDIAQPLIQRDVTDLGRAGYWLVKAILANYKKGKKNLNQVIELHKQISQLVNEKLVSRQYMMASACEATLAHLTLSSHQRDAAESQKNKEQALQASKLALQIYEQFGFVQIIECSSQEILYRHSLALKANQDLLEASSYLEKAYAEMMRKYDLIPAYSPYRKSYLEEIGLHKRIIDEYIAEKQVSQQSGQALEIRKQQ